LKSVDVSEQDTWSLKANLPCRTFVSVSGLFLLWDLLLEALKVVPQVEVNEVGVPSFYVLQLKLV
jgi:hypothetical protein